MIWLALAAMSALAYWRVSASERLSWPRSCLKTISVALLAGFGLISEAPSAIVTGLMLGAAGDFFLSRPGERAFLAGMASFAAGHLAYLWAFLYLGGGFSLGFAGCAFLVLAISTEFWLTPRTNALRWPIRGYIVIISLLALSAIGLPAGFALAKTGAFLFIFSDLLLAIHLFIKPHRLLALILWPAYWTGQLLILIGFQ